MGPGPVVFLRTARALLGGYRRAVLLWSPEVLTARLSRNLGPRRDGLELVVGSIDAVRSGEGVDVVLGVTATNQSLSKPQSWRVAFPTSAAALSELHDLDTFVLLYRAALEEWWDVRGYEPQTARLGTRIR